MSKGHRRQKIIIQVSPDKTFLLYQLVRWLYWLWYCQPVPTTNIGFDSTTRRWLFTQSQLGDIN